jgi:DnaK suppressor protein
MLREMLSRIQDETRRRINDLRRDQEQFDSEAVHVMDYASTIGEMETHAGLARAEEKLRYIDEAMARLEAGKYGLCLKCAAAIPFERLMAVPFASYCVNCQKKLNCEEGGWGHAPYDRQWIASKELGLSPQPESSSMCAEESSTSSESEPAGSVQLKGKIVKHGLPKRRAGLDHRAARPRLRSQ